MRKFVPNTENDEEKAASTAPTPEPGGERLDLSSTTFDREKSHTTQPTDGCVLDYLRHTELEKKQIIVEENTLSGACFLHSRLPPWCFGNSGWNSARPEAGVGHGASCSPGCTHPAGAALEHKGKAARNPLGCPPQPEFLCGSQPRSFSPTSLAGFVLLLLPSAPQGACRLAFPQHRARSSGPAASPASLNPASPSPGSLKPHLWALFSTPPSLLGAEGSGGPPWGAEALGGGGRCGAAAVGLTSAIAPRKSPRLRAVCHSKGAGSPP